MEMDHPDEDRDERKQHIPHSPQVSAVYTSRSGLGGAKRQILARNGSVVEGEGVNDGSPRLRRRTISHEMFASVSKDSTSARDDQIGGFNLVYNDPPSAAAVPGPSPTGPAGDFVVTHASSLSAQQTRSSRTFSPGKGAAGSSHPRELGSGGGEDHGTSLYATTSTSSNQQSNTSSSAAGNCRSISGELHMQHMGTGRSSPRSQSPKSFFENDRASPERGIVEQSIIDGSLNSPSSMDRASPQGVDGAATTTTIQSVASWPARTSGGHQQQGGAAPAQKRYGDLLSESVLYTEHLSSRPEVVVVVRSRNLWSPSLCPEVVRVSGQFSQRTKGGTIPSSPIIVTE